MVVMAYTFGWGPDGEPRIAYEGWSWALPVGAVLALGVLRRPAPWLALCVVLALEFESRRAAIAAEPFTAAIALYSLADLRGRRQALSALAVSVGVLVASVPLAGRSTSGLVLCLVAYGVGTWLGLRIRRQRGRLAELEVFEARERRRHEELRLAEQARAAAEHRARIASEVHDVLTNSACLAARLSDAALVALDADDEDAARLAVEQTGSSSRAALQDIRHLVQTIRGERDVPPDESVTARDLIEGLARTGIAVRTDIVGAPLDPGVERTVRRVLREAFTNVLKHADATTVSILIAHADDGMTLRVENDGVVDGRGDDDRPGAGLGSGLGLSSMQTMVEEHGGTFRGGLTEERTVWALDIWIPHWNGEPDHDTHQRARRRGPTPAPFCPGDAAAIRTGHRRRR